MTDQPAQDSLVHRLYTNAPAAWLAFLISLSIIIFNLTLRKRPKAAGQCLEGCSRMGIEMTNELKEHLIRCANAMQSMKPILGKHSFPDDHRTTTVIGFVSTLVEQQESVLLLVMHEKPSAASALVRPIVEGAYRALWINLPAKDEEVQKFNEKDKIDLAFGEIATALDNAYGMGDFFQGFKTRTWRHLNSYTHGGMHQIGRRFIRHEVANNYPEQEIYEMTTTVTTIVLLAITFFLKRHGHLDSGSQVQQLVESYGPVADRLKRGE